MSDYTMMCAKCGTMIDWPNKCPKCPSQSVLATSEPPAPQGSLRCDGVVGGQQYHLLEERTIIRPDDEGLSHDCMSWWRMDSHPSGKWMIGSPYTKNLFVPMRRPGPPPADKITELLTPNK